ncbi:MULTISPECIES: BREX system ATP-binding domain-containing protein [Streptomyces]|uniref:BREX system ATP-binding domain-containing protein n=1 Tax=Streptomyces eurythermus TaxID=42237 RepID=A0ABW6Z7N5_9ACTN|nr:MULTISPECIES: LuxR family transcriptional regulator [Streptomyces]QIS74985.1 helix-turn-helix domain-containing protein [Streptomyces sp. DSM 40868]
MCEAEDGELLGRERETALLSCALEAAISDGRGTAVLLRGQAGIGKSALLTWARNAARRRGFAVVQAVGAVAEAELAFGGLHQVFWPLLKRSRTLPARDRDVLECALGLGEGPPAGAAPLGASALALLTEAARDRPLLILVDDVQWMDDSSTAVFDFLHRHVAALPVVFVGAGREDGPATERWTAEPVRVGALQPDAAEALLRRHHPTLPAAAATRVLTEAAGNPLALLELPALPEDEHDAGVPGAPGRMSLTHRLEHLFAERIRSLPADAAHVLLLAALGGRLDVREAGAGPVPAAPGTPAAVLAALEESGLAHLDGDGALAFRHPLVRSAVISLASPEDERAAHRFLAGRLETGDPRRLRHETLAAVLPDASLAERLEEAARQIARRGGDAEGAVLMDRAAALSADAASHTARLTWAAVMAARGGRLAHTAELVEELQRRPVPPGFAPLFAYAVVYVDQSHRIDFESSFTLLPQALDLLSRTGVEPFEGLAEQMYFKLLLATSYTDDPRGRRALEKHAGAVSPLARLCRAVWSDPPRTAHGAARELALLTQQMSEEQEAGAAWLLLWTAAAVDAADETLWRRFTGQHAYATQGSVAKARFYQDYLRGRWESAAACLREAEAADDRGYHCNALLFRHYYAHFLAGRGDEQGLREVEALIEPTASGARMRFVTDHLVHLRALVALAHGRYEEAYLLLVQLMPPGVLPRGLPWFHLPFFDLVVAAVHTGRRREAAAHVEAGRAARMADISGHHAFLLAAASAVAATDDVADVRYQAAYAVEGAETWVFGMARLRLAHGSWLRRRRRAEARDVLHRAHEAFRRLGAEPWAERCEEEMAAAGPAMATLGGRGLLTGQERRIAQLAATGLTNKEIGTALQVSPRTVAAHLYKIFPKLGVTSRAGISRALADDSAQQD